MAYSFYIYQVLQAYDKNTKQPIDPPLYTLGKKISATEYEDMLSCNNSMSKWGIEEGTYLCDNGEKYEKYVKMYLTSDGWVKVEPEQTKKGKLIESDSADCGVTWKPIEEYVCELTNRYQLVQKYLYGEPFEPKTTKKGKLIEEHSQDCTDFSGKVIDDYTNESLTLRINNTYTDISIINKRFYVQIDKKLTYCAYMFLGDAIEELEINLDTSHVSKFESMFSDSNLKKLTIKKMDTSNAIRLDFLFSDCSSLTELDLSMLNVSNVIYMTYIFFGCSSLTQLNISGWDLTNVYSDDETALNKHIIGCFSGCSKLQKILANGCNETTIKVINAALANAGLSDKVTIEV